MRKRVIWMLQYFLIILLNHEEGSEIKGGSPLSGTQFYILLRQYILSGQSETKRKSEFMFALNWRKNPEAGIMKVPQTLYFRINRWPTNPKDTEQKFATIPRRKTLFVSKTNSCKNRMLQTGLDNIIEAIWIFDKAET